MRRQEDRIPIFDSATHPTITGGWLPDMPNIKNRVSELLKEMAAADVRWGLALGMADIGGYDVDNYADFIRDNAPNLMPVAYCEFDRLTTRDDINRYVKIAATKGYAGIKI